MSNIIKLEIVEKYNPYHDSKGRFTSAGSATSFTIGSKSGLEWDKKNVQRAIEREKQRTSAKEDGPTKIKRVESELKGMLNKSATVDFTGMDPDVAEETAAEIKKVLDKYPGCKDAYGGFSTEEPVPGYFRVNENVVACYVPHTKTIHLNPNSYGNKEKLKADYEKDLIYGFHPEGTNYNASIVHEMGHAIDFYISNNRFGSYDVITKKKMVSAEIWETDLKKSKKTSGKLSEIVSESLSGYATKNSMEYLAEGFAEAMCSSNPRPTAKSIMKRFENQIKKFSEA